jgi:pimeloyl-ACP methyl ester carboxylesterase
MISAMASMPPPRYEGRLRLPDDRRLGFAEFGAPSGRAVLWFHGTPGGRCQIPPAARNMATARNIRLVGVERPGIGHSTGHLYRSLVDYAKDVEVLCDHLGIDRFGVVGLSGGGPYVLACAAALPDRVVAGCVLGGVAPLRGDEGIDGGAVGFFSRLQPILPLVNRPLGSALSWLIRGVAPVASPIADLFFKTMPPGDQAVMSRPEMKEMFIDDLLVASQGGCRAFLDDLLLFTRPWGFHLKDVSVPVHFWHGDADTYVPLDHGRHQADLVPGARLYVRPTEGHMGSLDAVEEILDAITDAWPTTTRIA